MQMKLRTFWWLAIFALSTISAVAQNSAASSAAVSSGNQAGNAVNPSVSATSASTQVRSGEPSADPLKRPLTEQQKKGTSKALKQELSSTYKKWLNEDVVYIITPEERTAFKQLSNDEERDQFIEQFWLRRDPTPDTPENEYKEEHYRRIAYADDKFVAGIDGWRTDRGRIYIIWGPPDSIEAHPAGGYYERPMEEGGGTTSTFPFEDWHYRDLAGVGQDVTLEFVDPCMCNEYHLTGDPNEKDALLHTPNAGETEYEEMGLANKSDRVGQGPFDANNGPMQQMQSTKQFDRLEQLAKVMAPPPVKFKDLEADVTSRLVRDQLKYDYRFDFMRITSDTVLVPITVQVPTRQLTFQEKNGVDTATMNVFARVTSLSGRVIQTFEDTLQDQQVAAGLQKSLGTAQIYQKQVPLSPGLYKLDIVIKDVNSGNVGVVDTRLAVPRFQDDTLSTSSLVLSDEILPVSAKDIGLGQFVIGDLKVRPKLDSTFTQADEMGIFLQVYNLKVDDKTHKADATVEYRVMKEKETAPVLKFTITSDKLPQHGEELTLADRITLGSLAPGKYTLEVAITDNLAKQSINPTGSFTVKASPATAAQGR